MMNPSTVARGAGLLAAALLIAAASDASAGSRILGKSKFDPNARKVDIFDGIDQGDLDVRIIAKDSTGGNVLIENKTDEPLSVKLPQAFVGVQVLKQFGGGTGLGGLSGPGGVGLAGTTGTGTGTGGAQPLGGMMGGMMGSGMGGMGMMGGGFYSIPPERIARIPFRSVCLAHGKPDPAPRMNYRMAPIEKFSSDETLPELIKLLGNSKVDQHALQAATWHITDGMSWQELANKRVEHLGGRPATPYFSLAHLRYAQQAFLISQKNAEEARKAKPADSKPVREPDAPVVRRPLSSVNGR